MSNRLLAGRYELIEKIGEGGMAIVYKAKCRLLNRYVAIKILRPEFTKDEQFVENFRRESQAAAGLSHPNIVSVYDVGQEGNIHFIVMELVEGKTLSELIEEKGRLDYKEAINITRQVASALSLAHKNQIVHRDIKPHNILITNTGVAKLADFGIAKAVSASTIIGGNNKVMGSVHYFSPEQARGAYVDERSDIYSLGIVLYEMLTGKVPFDGDNPISIALMHINDPMPSVSAEVPGIPPQLEKIIMKATDKYQTNRYRTADEMIEDLDNIEFITKVMGQKAFTIAGEEEKEQPAVSVHPERERTHRKSEPAGNTEESDKTLERANKISTGFIIGAVAVLVIAGIIGLGALLGWFSGDSEEIKVPNFVGSTFEKAQALAQETGLEIARGEDVYSPDQEEGKITSQNPTADSVVSPGKLITVYVSKGKKDGVVPKIVGMDYKGASEYLKTFGFELGIVKTESSTLPENVIIEQSVEEGSTALKGTKIDVTVSDGKGKETVKMPNLIGKTPDEANAIIDTEGLKLGDATYEETTTTAQNLIFWQQYPEGTELEKGTAVSYKVSKGEKPSGSGSEDFGDGTESADE
jgi:serine/threonine protein kinase/beta-lactam-binding protein with PASTA domain